MPTVPGGLFESYTDQPTVTLTGGVSVDVVGILGSFGLTDSGTQVTGTGAEFINSFSNLITMPGASSDLVTVPGGGAATVIGAETSDSIIGGQSESILISDSTSTSPVQATLDIGGNLQIAVELPAGINLQITGSSEPVTLTQMTQYLESQLEAIIPSDTTDPAALEYRETLQNAFQQIAQTIQAIGDGNTSVNVQIINLADLSDTRAAGNVQFRASNSASGSKDVLAFRIGELKGGKALEVSNVENALLIGKGQAIVADNTSSKIFGDGTDQSITGGGGNDTLVGGGGSDTLVGGTGDDSFGFNKLGHYVLQDFNSSDDLMMFNFDNVSSLSELAQHLTQVATVGGNAVFEFTDAASITLVGVSADQVTTDLLKFTF